MHIGIQKLAVFSISLLGMLSTTQVLADTVPTINCTDHEHRYILQDLELSPGEGSLASLTFLDTFVRLNFSLFCGIDTSHINRTEIACVSSHLGGNGPEPIVRARIHKQSDPNLSRIALIEVQRKDQPVGTINDVIPLVCD